MEHKFKAFDQLVKDEQSCIKLCKKIFTIPLPPFTLGQEAPVIERMFRKEWKNKYNPMLKGILLAYDDLSFVSDHGFIKDDFPFIFWKVSAKCYIFTPEVGKIIRGRITKFTKSDVINCLVNGSVVATILSNETSSRISKSLKLGQDLLFRIISLDLNHSFLNGCIDEECVLEMQKQGILEEKSESTEETLEMSNIEQLFE